MTDLKNRLTDFITPLSCPADEVDPISSKKRDLQARDYSLAGGMTLMNELAAFQNARTYTADLGIQAFDSIYGLEYGLSYEELTNFTTYAMMGTDLTVGEAMVSALCEGKSAYNNLVSMEGSYGDLCINPSLASKKRSFHYPVVDNDDRPASHLSHGTHHKHRYGQVVNNGERNEKRVFDADTTSTTGSTSTHGRPFTGALLDAIVNGNDVTYLYSRRIDYRWSYTHNGIRYYVNQNILEGESGVYIHTALYLNAPIRYETQIYMMETREIITDIRSDYAVAFDITDSPTLQEHTDDIFAVFHFHVEELAGNFVGVRSFGVYHSQTVIPITSTGDYRVYPGFNPNDSGTITIAARNRRAHVLNCEDDNDDEWISREFLPGYTLTGTMPEGNYNIYEFGQWLYANNIVVPAAFPNYDTSTGFSYTRGHETANFRNDGVDVPDLSGYPHA
ncbi:hypothetical protein N7466_001631 [Penicillium verhagenii]|uniref:uncharacterized protein n=1 Tax=Penicillium verhagenii TaxID=1562060 RepID=UPI0025452B2A|nr:uncharacterized protein N7466_001631 [Penicillium verhagenii]KAJ5938497.1 hypothetical protein N7466_001631 [Penicillium verhagenii]